MDEISAASSGSGRRGRVRWACGALQDPENEGRSLQDREAGPSGSVEPAGSLFEGQGPSVLQDDGRYVMWYDARAPGPDRSIVSVGLAASADGQSWAKHGGSPVIPAEARWPCVLPLPGGDGFRIWFGTEVGLAIQTARSADGITWTDVQTALSAGSPGQFDDLNAACPRVVQVGDEYLMLYDVGSSAQEDPTDKFQGLGLARSPDGVNWTKHGVVLPLGLEGTPDSYRVFGACILYDDRARLLHVWYTATGSMRDIRSIRHAGNQSRN